MIKTSPLWCRLRSNNFPLSSDDRDNHFPKRCGLRSSRWCTQPKIIIVAVVTPSSDTFRLRWKWDTCNLVIFTGLSEDSTASIFRRKEQPQRGKIYYGRWEDIRDGNIQVSAVPIPIPVPHASTVSLVLYVQDGSNRLLRKVTIIFSRLYGITVQKRVVISPLYFSVFVRISIHFTQIRWIRTLTLNIWISFRIQFLPL
jgi:hypothetical protein